MLVTLFNEPRSARHPPAKHCTAIVPSRESIREITAEEEEEEEEGEGEGEDARLQRMA